MAKKTKARVGQDSPVPSWDRKPIQGLNDLQKRYINSIQNHTITVGTGVAGSGKTYIAATLAADMLSDNRWPIDKIIIARPNEIEGTKSIGFLKGDKNDKMMPLVAPVVETLKKRLGPGFFEYCLNKEKIELSRRH